MYIEEEEEEEIKDSRILNHYYYFNEIKICVGLAYDDNTETFSVVIGLQNYYDPLRFSLREWYNFLSYFLYIDSYFNSTTTTLVPTKFSLSAIII